MIYVLALDRTPAYSATNQGNGASAPLDVPAYTLVFAGIQRSYQRQMLRLSWYDWPVTYQDNLSTWKW